jgi:hypothetical protein
MQRVSSFLLTAIAAAGLMLLTGCDANTSSNGTADVTMTDGASKTLTTSKSHVATDLKEAAVTITKITAVPADEDESSDNGESAESDDEDESGAVLTSDQFDLDLTELAANDDTTLTDLSIPTGNYGQVRLHTTGEVLITFKDDSQSSAKIASSVLKLNFASPFAIGSADDKVDITVDWNVENALEGNLKGTLVITPVVEASAEVISATTEGDTSN